MLTLTFVLFCLAISVLFSLTISVILILCVMNLQRLLKPLIPTKSIPSRPIREERPPPPSYTVEAKEGQKMIKGARFPSARPRKPTKRVPPPTPRKKEPLVMKDSEKQTLLGMLMKKGVLELKPTLTVEGVRYVEVEEALGVTDPLWMRSSLESLEKEGTIEPRFFDRVLTCPDCGSPEAYSKYACPRCDSYNVEFTELLEHTKCGRISSKGDFIKGSSLICPGCQVPFLEEAAKYELLEEGPKYEFVEKGEYRVIGSCYQCEKCGHRFDEPEIVHFCQHCKRSFTHKEAKYIKLYAYKIADKIIEKFGRTLPLLETIGNTLREKGFTAKFHHQISGVSGVVHPFDIVAEKGEALVVVDLSIGGDKSDAVSLLGKKIDVNPAQSLLVDLSDREELTSLGKVYGITVVKGGDKKKLEDDLRSILTTVNSTKG